MRHLTVKLDKVATELEKKGLIKLATELDVVSNSIDKEAITFDDLVNAKESFHPIITTDAQEVHVSSDIKAPSGEYYRLVVVLDGNSLSRDGYLRIDFNSAVHTKYHLHGQPTHIDDVPFSNFLNHIIKKYKEIEPNASKLTLAQITSDLRDQEIGEGDELDFSKYPSGSELEAIVEKAADLLDNDSDIFSSPDHNVGIAEPVLKNVMLSVKAGIPALARIWGEDQVIKGLVIDGTSNDNPSDVRRSRVYQSLLHRFLKLFLPSSVSATIGNGRVNFTGTTTLFDLLDKKGTAKLASRLDKIADSLERMGRPHLAVGIDLVSNSLEKLSTFRSSLLPGDLAFRVKQTPVSEQFDRFMRFLNNSNPYQGIQLDDRSLKPILDIFMDYKNDSYENQLSKEVQELKERYAPGKPKPNEVADLVAKRDAENSLNYKKGLTELAKDILPTKDSLTWLADLYRESGVEDVPEFIQGMLPLAATVKTENDKSLIHDMIHHAPKHVINTLRSARSARDLIHSIKKALPKWNSIRENMKGAKLTKSEEAIYNRAIIIKDFKDGFKWVMLLGPEGNPCSSIDSNISQKTHANCGMGVGTMYQLRFNNNVVIDASVDGGYLAEAKGYGNRLPSDHEIDWTLPHMAWFFLHGDNGKPLKGTDFDQSGVKGHDYGIIQLSKMNKKHLSDLAKFTLDDEASTELNPDPESYKSPATHERFHRALVDKFRSDEGHVPALEQVEDGAAFVADLQNEHGMTADRDEQSAVNALIKYRNGDITERDILKDVNLLPHWKAILGKNSTSIFKKYLTDSVVRSLLLE